MEIRTAGVNALYTETLWWAKFAPHDIEDTRVGKAKVYAHPLTICNTAPQHRVLMHPQRNANPFFHLMECIWMCAGSNERWITQFNKQMEQYMDYGVFHGAYGHRWSNHFGFDQVKHVIKLLKRSDTSRRAYVSLWNPTCDLDQDYKDIPCNVGLAFQVRQGKLNGYVFNRSNDLIWGMLGTNCVHFSFLLEVIANCTGLPMGHLYQHTINPHIYDRHWELLQVPDSEVPAVASDFPIDSMNYELWIADCARFLEYGQHGQYQHEFLNKVAKPMCGAYLDKDKGALQYVQASDWRRAGELWWEKNRAEKAT